MGRNPGGSQGGALPAQAPRIHGRLQWGRGLNGKERGGRGEGCVQTKLCLQDVGEDSCLGRRASGTYPGSTQSGSNTYLPSSARVAARGIFWLKLTSALSTLSRSAGRSSSASVTAGGGKVTQGVREGYVQHVIVGKRGWDGAFLISLGQGQVLWGVLLEVTLDTQTPHPPSSFATFLRDSMRVVPPDSVMDCRGKGRVVSVSGAGGWAALKEELCAWCLPCCSLPCIRILHPAPCPATALQQLDKISHLQRAQRLVERTQLGVALAKGGVRASVGPQAVQQHLLADARKQLGHAVLRVKVHARGVILCPVRASPTLSQCAMSHAHHIHINLHRNFGPPLHSHLGVLPGRLHAAIV